MFFYDFFESHNNYSKFELYDLDDIDAAFSQIRQLKFLESFALGPSEELKIIPEPAGHMIGGAMWRIKQSNGENIVYAPTYNHKSDLHIDGGTLGSIDYKISALITNLVHYEQSEAFKTQNMSSKHRQKSLIGIFTMIS